MSLGRHKCTIASALFYFLSFQDNTRKTNHERSSNARAGGESNDRAGLQKTYGEKARIKNSEGGITLWQQYL
jgi:hypothetical protein